MSKKTARGTAQRGTVSRARKTATGHTPPAKVRGARDAAANNPDVPDRLERDPDAPMGTQDERDNVRYGERARAARRTRPAVEVALAAPTRVHQPVKESGFGTPSADARPGRAADQHITLDADVEEEVERFRRRMTGRIKVQATKTGFYDNIRRRPGEVFWLHSDGSDIVEDVNGKKKVRASTAEDAFSSRWMRRVSDKTPLTGTKGPNQVIQERHDEILGKTVKSKNAVTVADDVDDDNPLGAED